MYKKVATTRNGYLANQEAIRQEKIRRDRQERQERQEKKERYFQQQKAQAELEEKKQKELRKQHIKSIREGKKQVKSLDDATIFYSAKDGKSIVTNPPLTADNNYYVVSGKLEKKDDDFYVVKIESWDNINYFTFKLSKKVAEPEFRIGYRVGIVAKLVDIGTYQTLFGAERYMPVFLADYVRVKKTR
jgi:hypothetical protein